MKAIEIYLRNRKDLRLYKYLNNNGLAVIFKVSTKKENTDENNGTKEQHHNTRA